MDYCPSCRKYVNTSDQKIELGDEVHISIACEECTQMIRTKTEKTKKEKEDGQT